MPIMQSVFAQLAYWKAMNFRIFYATDWKTSESFRVNQNKVLKALRGKSSFDLIVVVQSFTMNGGVYLKVMIIY
jgi:hypothetical protein